MSSTRKARASLRFPHLREPQSPCASGENRGSKERSKPYRYIPPPMRGLIVSCASLLVSSQGPVLIINRSTKFALIHNPCSSRVEALSDSHRTVSAPCPNAAPQARHSLSLPLVISDQRLGLRRATYLQAQPRKDGNLHGPARVTTAESTPPTMSTSSFSAPTPSLSRRGAQRPFICAFAHAHPPKYAPFFHLTYLISLLTLPNRVRRTLVLAVQSSIGQSLCKYYSVPWLIRRIQQSLHPLTNVRVLLTCEHSKACCGLASVLREATSL
ncbi:hypothetical protein AUEXF2481DRAFT_355514 [Aureobasidium subglaciale EXF-2481]|uniref:Uncharacterized protein n=1 Tax=Aureobasidium subglaciale (strain EXF-2481) TaxID=1043005 RepID=A0A074Y620_AURSE|nr:uncharacterized protein AUEXF2481DRAFT_355514 [Aureobasidium subglaciale EXF-2481]KEQ93140.1 hypothetical protein AUEXF2481DRAFT_355514 [Aureobasidium subglaciale EXF-2481]